MKKLVFLLHNLFRYITLYGWVVSKKVLYLQAIVMLSWYFNNNKCLACVLENYIFGETFLENNSVYVNKAHRYELYVLFLVGIIYYYI